MNLFSVLHNIHYWFSEQVLYRLSRIKCALDHFSESPAKYLFWIAFSETIRACSYVRQDEFNGETILKSNDFSEKENLFRACLVADIRTAC